MINTQFPLDFWTYEPIVYEVDNEDYVDMDDFDKAKDPTKFVENN
jgi:hypothetical protein